MKVKINITLKDKSYTTTLNFDYPVPEYVIADEAYRISLLYAETQYIAYYGHPIVMHEFAEMLKDLDYEYTYIEDEED